MAWPTKVDELVREQRALAALEPSLWKRDAGGVSIGGCFICFPRGRPGAGEGGDPAWAGVALIDLHGGVATALVEGSAGAPYQAGLLALREGPLLEAAVLALPELPEVLLVNATGRDHPRGAGLALHLGWRLSIPSIGVTHRPLLAEGDWPEPVRGAARPLLLGGREVGAVVCTRDRLRPLFVHPGWRTNIETAIEVVLAVCTSARTPEPIRRARQVARTARSAALHGAPAGRLASQ